MDEEIREEQLDEEKEQEVEGHVVHKYDNPETDDDDQDRGVVSKV
jgi:hypothetical protein